MEPYQVKAFATNILNDVLTSNSELYPLHVEYDKLLLWVQRVVYKKLGFYKSDVELMKQYYVVKTFVHDVLQQRVRQKR
jgi:hypothetical protein